MRSRLDIAESDSAPSSRSHQRGRTQVSLGDLANGTGGMMGLKTIRSCLPPTALAIRSPTRSGSLIPKVKGVSRDGERLVTGSDGSAYHTTDRYKNFIRLG